MTVSRKIINSFDGEYAFLSNFYELPMKVDGIDYSTLEAAFQATKTFDIQEKMKVAALDTPGKAKRMGRKVRLRSDWEAVKVEIMYRLLKIKFQDPYLRSLLLATGDAYLEEGNTWGDKFWGVYNGVGDNVLGQLLMQVREEIWEDIMAGPLTKLNYIYNPSLHYWDSEGKLRWLFLDTLVPLSKNKYNAELKLQVAAKLKALASKEIEKMIGNMPDNE